jgi:hypothetical protein
MRRRALRTLTRTWLPPGGQRHAGGAPMREYLSHTRTVTTTTDMPTFCKHIKRLVRAQ